MKKFMDRDFLLESETASYLYHEHAAKMPIIDFHNHLNVKEIYEDIQFENITKLWLGGDHYKWRALRAYGIEEKYITGDAKDKEKFDKWAETVPYMMGNPLYHWTHLELQRYFEIYDPLTSENKNKMYAWINQKLQDKDYSVRNLLRQMKVEALCTTDDPADDLIYHKKLKDDFEIKVLPTFRPDRALNIEKDDFVDYINDLGQFGKIENLEDLLGVLEARIDYFHEVGCRISDHSLGEDLYLEADSKEVEEIFAKKLRGEEPTSREIKKYKGYLMKNLGRKYASKDWAMQIHMGALRNNSSRMFEKLGPDSGYDSMNDYTYAEELSNLLDSMDRTGELPRTVLYNLNGRDNLMLASMAGNFQGENIKAKVQFGAAWWFLDTREGMIDQIKTLSSVGLLSTFIGMLTDSRSFLSFPRHEYFRRILCNEIGNLVESGQYPNDRKTLGKIVEDICYYNAKNYFNL